VKRIPNNKFLGTRNPNKPGKPYEWRTWREIYDIVDLYAKGKYYFCDWKIFVGYHTYLQICAKPIY
jgi:hypothetical protein